MKKEMTTNQAEQAVVVKRGHKGKFTLVTGNPNKAVIGKFLAHSLITDYKGNMTEKVTQCTIINKMLLEGAPVSDIADRLIKLKLFPAVAGKYPDAETTMKAANVRVNRHISATFERTTAPEICEAIQKYYKKDKKGGKK